MSVGLGKGEPAIGDGSAVSSFSTIVGEHDRVSHGLAAGGSRFSNLGSIGHSNECTCGLLLDGTDGDGEGAILVLGHGVIRTLVQALIADRHLKGIEIHSLASRRGIRVGVAVIAVVLRVLRHLARNGVCHFLANGSGDDVLSIHLLGHGSGLVLNGHSCLSERIQHAILNVTGANEDCDRRSGSSIGANRVIRVHKQVQACRERHSSGSAISGSTQINLFCGTKLVSRGLQRFHKLTGSAIIPCTICRIVHRQHAFGERPSHQIAAIGRNRLISACNSSFERSLDAGVIRHRAGSLHTVRCIITSAVLHIIGDLVGVQLTIDQLLGVLSSECEIHLTSDDSAAAVSLCACRAQGHAAQQRRSGGDAGEKFPHLHENPLSLCC